MRPASENIGRVCAPGKPGEAARAAPLGFGPVQFSVLPDHDQADEPADRAVADELRNPQGIQHGLSGIGSKGGDADRHEAIQWSGETARSGPDGALGGQVRRGRPRPSGSGTGAADSNERV